MTKTKPLMILKDTIAYSRVFVELILLYPSFGTRGFLSCSSAINISSKLHRFIYFVPCRDWSIMPHFSLSRIKPTFFHLRTCPYPQPGQNCKNTYITCNLNILFRNTSFPDIFSAVAHRLVITKPGYIPRTGFFENALSLISKLNLLGLSNFFQGMKY